jgi:uncharacterized protein (TIGR02231 family)
MKILLLLTSSCLLTLNAAYADLVPLTSRISEVMVYPDRARITRTGEVLLPSGESIVQFLGLPADLDESSVQARGESGEAVRILGLDIRNKYSERTLNENARKLQDEIQLIQDQARKLEDEARDLTERRDFLLKLKENMTRDLGKDVKANQVSVTTLKGTYDFYSSELKIVTERVRGIEFEKRALQPKLQKLEEEVARLQSAQPTVQKEVLVSVKSEEVAKSKLHLSYLMKGASWQPLYDARAHINTSQVDLTYYGIVRQQTGEDWKDVNLSLSTARPNVGGRMQELNPWHLNYLQMLRQNKADLRGKIAGMRDQLSQNSYDDMNAPATAIPREARKEQIGMEEDTTTLESRGVSVVFHVKIPTSIPSDSEPHKSAISTHTFKGKLDYATTPKMMESAFLKARLTNSTDAPILGGEVNLFLEDDFVGKSYVNFIAPTADFDFFLGVDDGIKVTRKQLSDHRDTSGIIKKSNDLTRKFEITIENFKKTAQSVNVYDQIPVSQNGEIQVSGLKFSDTPKVQDKDTGKVSWEVSLKPREKKTIVLEFQIQWPQGKELGGV